MGDVEFERRVRHEAEAALGRAPGRLTMGEARNIVAPLVERLAAAERVARERDAWQAEAVEARPLKADLEVARAELATETEARRDAEARVIDLDRQRQAAEAARVHAWGEFVKAQDRATAAEAERAREAEISATLTSTREGLQGEVQELRRLLDRHRVALAEERAGRLRAEREVRDAEAGMRALVRMGERSRVRCEDAPDGRPMFRCGACGATFTRGTDGMRDS